MEHNIELSPLDRYRADQLQAEHRELLARYGAATLEIEIVRQLLPQVKERQRQLIDELAQRAGVTQYLGARIDGGRLICQLPAGAKPNGQEAPAAS